MTTTARRSAPRGVSRLPLSRDLEDLVDLDARLRLLAAVSGDSYRYAVGQALDTVAALLDAHAGGGPRCSPDAANRAQGTGAPTVLTIP